MANSYRVSVGRLLEVRLDAHIRTAADVDAWFQGVGIALGAVPAGVRAVVIADWRSCPLLSSEASERAFLRLTQSNPRVERSAALVSPDSAVTVLQFLRLCRGTGNPSRDLFTEVPPLVTWLGAVLTPAERQRLDAFLLEYNPKRATG
jgi:hypothetical protein